MVRNLVFVLVALAPIFISGCATFAGEGKSGKLTVQESLVPILYCPKPPEVEKPTLPIESLTDLDKSSPGTVAKKYKATVKTLQGYANQLEESLKSYEEAHDAYEDLRKKFKQQSDAGEFDSIKKEDEK